MNKVQFIRTPSGEELAVLPRSDHERLLEELEMQEDVRLYDEALRALDAGEDELIPSEFVYRLCEGENPVRVWREFRGLDPETLAAQVGIDLGRLAQIEAGAEVAEGETLLALARALRVDVEDMEKKTD